MRVVHAIHDFLPRHAAGSEIYARDLCLAQAARHAVTVLCAEYNPERGNGDVVWRVHDGLPVAEIINNWTCTSFEDSYRSHTITKRIASVLHTIQPHVLHVHSFLNLSFDVIAVAGELGIPIVATLHDHSLVCPSGGQRIHRAEHYVCHAIDPSRCARCFRQSPFFGQIAFGPVAALTRRPGLATRVARDIARRLPGLGRTVLHAAMRATPLAVTAEDIERRLAAARDVFKAVDVWIAPSPFIGREFERMGIDPSRILVSDYGSAPLPSRQRAPVQLPLRVGFVGTLVWHKGVHVLLEAMRGLPQDKVVLTIFGDPDVFPDYSAELRRLATGCSVRFAGAFDRNQTADIYEQMDVLVVPSLWLENSPLVIHEAFMAGVPVVGARMGGIPDLVDEGVSGALYEADSATALREVLRRFIDRPESLSHLTRGLPRVKSIDEDALALERIYEPLIARRGGKRYA